MKQEMANEIVFFDLETNVPRKAGQKFWVLEFGAMVVCPRKLVELESYCTLIRPGDLTAVGVKSGRVHGITRGAVLEAPSFEEVADKIFGILNGRIWAGHNIRRFDCVRIREAFKEIDRPAPEPVGLIDSLGVLTEKFGRRAGNMKMASLATYFGLGEQKHRSLDDVRMNLEVLKHCATVLFLESSLPNVLEDQWQHDLSPSITTRSKSNIKSKPYGEEISRKSPSSVLTHHRVVPYPTGSLRQMTEKVKIMLRNARNTPLNNLIKHSHTLLR
ncbi:protein NEN4 isoform X2 [Cynara cardunculus var. scolymus]|uniref:protein NEN4 isoform X2 n=1 Tax=Cynara cardunculus var. scolymus TaxID=59895 RepID=UPI000D62E4AC|nr:protein NEN4 isoform X2 [Cynara cardunculus var. scolymus]